MIISLQAQVKKAEAEVDQHQKLQDAYQQCCHLMAATKNKLAVCAEASGDRQALQNRLDKVQVNISPPLAPPFIPPPSFSFPVLVFLFPLLHSWYVLLSRDRLAVTVKAWLDKVEANEILMRINIMFCLNLL